MTHRGQPSIWKPLESSRSLCRKIHECLAMPQNSFRRPSTLLRDLWTLRKKSSKKRTFPLTSTKLNLRKKKTTFQKNSKKTQTLPPKNKKLPVYTIRFYIFETSLSPLRSGSGVRSVEAAFLAGGNVASGSNTTSPPRQWTGRPWRRRAESGGDNVFFFCVFSNFFTVFCVFCGFSFFYIMLFVFFLVFLLFFFV